MHAGSPLATPPAQRTPQERQLFGSVIRFTHVPAQSVVGDVQLLMHAPLTHAEFAPVHAWAAPHPPQLLLSVIVSTHDVPPSPPVHEVKPALHATPQVLAEQVEWALAWLVEHAWPQPPQFSRSVRVSMHPPPQSVSPVGQLVVHDGAPPSATHAIAAPASFRHRTPHAPQLLLSFCSLTHVPPPPPPSVQSV